MIVALPPGSREALATHAASLDALGFEVETFGGESVRITAVPALLNRDEAVERRARARR